MMRRERAGFRTVRRGRVAPVPLMLAAVLPLSGCAGAPAVNVVGSYFPAWMLCALVGIAVAVCFRQVLVLIGLENSLVAPLITHAAVALAVTLAVWLVWFGH